MCLSGFSSDDLYLIMFQARCGQCEVCGSDDWDPGTGCSSEGEHNVVITMFHQSSSSGVTPSPGQGDKVQGSQAGIKLFVRSSIPGNVNFLPSHT